jgi:hypothetical protein
MNGDYFFTPAIPLEYGKPEAVAQLMLQWVAEVCCVGARRKAAPPDNVKQAAHCLAYLLRNGVFKTTAPPRGSLEPRRILCEPKPETCEPVIAALEELLATLP